MDICSNLKDNICYMRSTVEYQRWLNSSLVDEKDKATLKKMSPSEIDDAFFKDLEFGTGGMRGILGPGTNRLNYFTIRKANIGFAIYLLESYPDVRKNGIVIAHDNRHKSIEFTNLCAKILNEFGIKVYIFDSLRPTPELSFAIRYLKASGGIMITASHNPKEYNGYKLYDDDGCQLVPNKIDKIISIIKELPNELDVKYSAIEPLGETIVLDSKIDDEYINNVEKITINKNPNKESFKIVFTPNHGTSFVPAMRVFKDLGYNVFPLEKQCSPDPDFSHTLSPNPEDEKSFIEPIKYANEINANLIVMTDPDGDRCGLAYKDRNNNYVRLTGNQSAAILMEYLFSQRKKNNTLSKNGAVYTTIVSSSLGVKIAKSYGIKVEEFLTGFKYIGNQINKYEKEGNDIVFEFGYEESYGCLISPIARDKDGIQAILMYSEMALYYHNLGKTLGDVLEELSKKYGYHENLLHSLIFPGSEGKKRMDSMMDKIRKNAFFQLSSSYVIGYEDYLTQTKNLSNKIYKINLPVSNVIKLYFNNDSTLTIRPSGTEPKIKLYIESVSNDPKKAKQNANSLFNEIKNILGL